MSCKLFVALAFVILLHLVQAAANRRTCRTEYPRALSATPSLGAGVFDPYHLSHRIFPGLGLSSLLRKFLFTTKVNRSSPELSGKTPAQEASAACSDRDAIPHRMASVSNCPCLPGMEPESTLCHLNWNLLETCFPHLHGRYYSSSSLQRSSPPAIRGKSLICFSPGGGPRLRGI
jgi:hypothetical protein